MRQSPSNARTPSRADRRPYRDHRGGGIVVHATAGVFWAALAVGALISLALWATQPATVVAVRSPSADQSPDERLVLIQLVDLYGRMRIQVNELAHNPQNGSDAETLTSYVRSQKHRLRTLDMQGIVDPSFRTSVLDARNGLLHAWDALEGLLAQWPQAPTDPPAERIDAALERGRQALQPLPSALALSDRELAADAERYVDSNHLTTDTGAKPDDAPDRERKQRIQELTELCKLVAAPAADPREGQPGASR